MHGYLIFYGKFSTSQNLEPQISLKLQSCTEQTAVSESERLEYNRVLNNNRVMSESERLEYNRIL